MFGDVGGVGGVWGCLVMFGVFDLWCCFVVFGNVW